MSIAQGTIQRVPSLDHEQRQVLNTILATARRRNASPMELKAAVETGLVESGLRNLPGGDADSQGWRQERRSLYANPRDLQASVNRFFSEVRQRRGRFGSAGDLAAAVQRPAAQYRGRYAGVSGQADALLRQGGGVTTRRRGAPDRGGPSTVEAGTPATSDGQALAALLLTQPSAPPRPQSMGLQAPAFAAHAVTPQGAMAVQSTAPPQESPGAALSKALAAAATLGDGTATSVAGSPESGVQTPDVLHAGTVSAHGVPSAGAQTALGWMVSKLGSRETAGENRGGLASFVNRQFGMEGQPWCAMMTSLAVTKGGAPASARTASVAQVREKMQAGQGYQRGYIPRNRAKPGDLILFGNQHIAMIESVEHDGTVRYVGGNQSDSVTRGKARNGDIVRPLYGRGR